MSGRGMVTVRARRELERSASWPAAASGLRWLIVCWASYTLLSLGGQMTALHLGALARGGDPGALAAYVLTSLLSQLAYSIFAALLVVSAAKLTRAPPSSGAVLPALVAGIGLLLAALVNAVLLVADRAAPEMRSMDEAMIEQLWITLASSRAIALFALILALVRIGRATGVRSPAALQGAGFALAAIDTGYPLWRMIGGTRAQPESASSRGLLLLVQLVLAVLIVELGRRARRGALEQGKEAAREARLRALEGGEESAPDVPPARVPRASEEHRVPAAARVLVPPSRPVVWIISLTTSFAVALLPLWDALDHPPAAAELGMAAAGVVLGLLLGRVVAIAPFAGRAAFLFAAALALGYAGVTDRTVALERSHLVDGWPVCETGLDVRGELPRPEALFKGRYSGPRLATGEPCTIAAERRDLHLERFPSGGLQDGVIQIATRFPGDRARVLFGTLVVLIALGLAGALVFRAAGVEDKTVSPDADSDE